MNEDIFNLTSSDFEKLSEEDLELLILELTELKENYYNEQLNKKNQINKLYGSLANQFFPLFDVRLAESITAYGRYYIKSIGSFLNNFLKEKYEYNKEPLIYIHTDSSYFHLKPVYDKEFESWNIKNNKKTFVDFIYQKSLILKKMSDIVFFKLTKILNSKKKNLLKMDIETISDITIWNSNRYILRTLYEEGKLLKPKIKIIGMEITQSSTAIFTKKEIKNKLNNLLEYSEKELIRYIEKTKIKFKKEKILNISFNTKISNIKKYEINNNFTYKNFFIIKVIKDKINKENLNVNIKNKIFFFLENIEEEINKKNKINLKEINKNINLIKKLYENFLILEETKLLLININNFLKNKKNNFNLIFDLEDIKIKKGAPINAVASISYNNFIIKNKLNFPLIYNGDKIKYIYLKNDNPFNTHVIAYKNEDFLNYINLKNFINYSLQFEKSFLAPIREITESLSINTFKKESYFKFEELFK